MKRLIGSIIGVLALLFAGAGLITTIQPTGSAVAAERTVTLAVDDIKGGCPSCAFIVERALARVDGVVNVEVSRQAGTALVTFDETAVDIATLAQATAAAGFPSKPAE